MTARQFGRDTGDTYGRHALRNPGGDNVQRDVLHVVDLGELYARGFRIHPQRLDPAYVGAHREQHDDEYCDCWTVDELTESIAAESNR